MEYLLDPIDHKKLKVYINPEQVYMEFIYQHGSFSFHPKACQKLMNMKHTLLDKLNKIKHDFNVYFVEHLCNNLFVVIESPFLCVQLRYFNQDSGVYTPTFEGISLKEDQFHLLLDTLDNLYEKHAIFQVLNMCAVLHQNQEDYMNCYNCQCDSEDEEEEEEEEEEEDAH